MVFKITYVYNNTETPQQKFIKIKLKKKVVDQTNQLNRVLRLLEQEEVDISNKLRLFDDEDFDRRRTKSGSRYDSVRESSQGSRSSRQRDLEVNLKHWIAALIFFNFFFSKERWS